MTSQVQGERPMIRYSVTMDDVTAFNLFHCNHTVSGRRAVQEYRVRSTATVALLLLAVGVLISRTWSSGLGIWFPPAYALLGTALFITRQTSVLKSREFWRKRVMKSITPGSDRGLFCEHIITVDENGFTKKTPVSETRFAWAAIENIEADEHHTYIYTGSVMAITIPHENIIEGNFPAVLHAIKAHYRPEMCL